MPSSPRIAIKITNTSNTERNNWKKKETRRRRNTQFNFILVQLFTKHTCYVYCAALCCTIILLRASSGWKKRSKRKKKDEEKPLRFICQCNNSSSANRWPGNTDQKPPMGTQSPSISPPHPRTHGAHCERCQFFIFIRKMNLRSAPNSVRYSKMQFQTDGGEIQVALAHAS